MGAATTIWFTTLRIRSLFTPCCGWFNATVLGLFEEELGTRFCSNPESMVKDPDPNVSIGCVGPFTSKADDLFNNTFTTILACASQVDRLEDWLRTQLGIKLQYPDLGSHWLDGSITSAVISMWRSQSELTVTSSLV
ncbi:hypothetical protein DFH28DRAFT_931195 [Melampsora americana]|nr:hypothetical protein DFH28DRAFT_931195 [Melampsora americana]